MKKLSATPGKMRALLILCLLGTLISIGITFIAYTASKSTVQAVGKDTAPSIVAAQKIKATLANAHSNAMNAMVTKEKLGGKYWNMYRKDLNSLHEQLVDASKSISFGDEEKVPLMTISSNISAYEYTVGGAVANGAEISVDQFMEANRLMQQKILPASTALNNVNLSSLEAIYDEYSRNINILIVLMIILGIAFLVILITVQSYLYKNTKRIFNFGLLVATILFTVNLIYSANALMSVKSDLKSAKADAFTSINALWNAKAVAYNAKSIESLYLLHEGTGIVQTADTINFNLLSDRLLKDGKTNLEDGVSKGFLRDGFKNMAVSGKSITENPLIPRWEKYIEVDKKVHSLEYDSKHSEAIALSIGDAPGQGSYEFGKFDEVLSNTIKAYQEIFDSNINSAFKTLKRFPFVLLGFLLAISAACILGMKQRMDEYKV